MDRTFRFEDLYRANKNWMMVIPFPPGRLSFEFATSQEILESEKVDLFSQLESRIPDSCSMSN
jgi:hypothetical protein